MTNHGFASVHHAVGTPLQHTHKGKISENECLLNQKHIKESYKIKGLYS